MMLWVCSTPIGNWADISTRLKETLAMVDLVVCEDTRTTGQLLTHLGLNVPLMSLEKFSEARRLSLVVARLLSGESVALVSDAGTPAISDPGYRLVAAAVAAGVPVKPVAGPNAVTTLLSVAGISADQYTFVGFFPRKTAAFLALLSQLRANQYPIVGFESPNRVIERLQDLAMWDSDAFVCVGKELTKPYETVWRGAVNEVLSRLGASTVKGEFTVVIWPSPAPSGSVDAFVSEAKEVGLSNAQIMKIGTRWAGFSRNQLYEKILK